MGEKCEKGAMNSRKQMGLGIHSQEAEQVFERWKAVMGSPRSRLDPARAKAIDAMLAVGYSVEDLELAVFGCSVSPFHQGNNDRQMKFADIGLICRDAQHVDQFIALAEKVMAKQLRKAVEEPSLRNVPATAVPEALRKFVKT